MKTSRIVGIALAGLLGVGCGPIYGPAPAAPTTSQMPAEPVGLSGPPGGSADPGSGYDDQQSQQSQDPTLSGGNPYNPNNDQAYPNDVEANQPTQPADPGPADPYVEPSTDPNSTGYVMGNVTDSEIDSTLAPYGEWTTDADHGRVWRPHATVVGADFTPYDTCGTWVYTDYGWTFNCDYNWGWLPFHYGAWDWIGGGWGWVPDYTWGPGWVDWRYGNGHVGWRPSRPRGIRDHRGGPNNNRPDIRDHRRPRDTDWRFVRENDFGRRAANRIATADGLRLTSDVSRPQIRPRSPAVSVTSVMGTRLRGRVATTNRQPARTAPGRFDQRGGNGYRPPYRSNQPSITRPDRNTYDRQRPSYGQQRPSYGQRPNDQRYQQPRGYDPRYQNDPRFRGQTDQRYQPRPNDQRYQPRPNDQRYQPRPNDQRYQPRPNDQRYQPRPNDQRYQPSRDRSAPSRTYREPSRPSNNGGAYRPTQTAPSRSTPAPSRAAPSNSGSSRSSGSSSKSSGSSGSSSKSSGSSGGSSRGGGRR